MPNTVRSRASGGDRSPGLIDSSAIFASHFLFENKASLNFGGTNEYVTGPSTGSLGLTFTNQLSVGIWVKANETPHAFQGIVTGSSSWNTLDDGWALYWWNTDDIAFFINNFSGQPNAKFFNLSDATAWNFIVGTYDGTLLNDNLKVYVNAVLDGVATGNYQANMTTQTANVEIGRVGNADVPEADYAVANMDEFGLWNTGLSADEVTALYNNGVPINLAVNSGDYISRDNLALWWRCGDKGDSNTENGIQDQRGVADLNPGTMINMEDGDIDTVDFAGA